MTTAPAVGLLAVRSAAVVDPGPLLDLLPEHGGLAWTQDGEGLVGWGEAARLDLAAGAPDRFAHAQRWWDALVASAEVDDAVGVPGSGLVAFGSFGFDPGAASSVLVVPQVVVGRRGGTWWVTTVGDVDPVLPVRTPPRAPSAVRFADGSRSGAEWVQVVAAAVERIRGGELDKVVLARDLEARTGEPLDLRWPLRRLARDYTGCWTFCVDALSRHCRDVEVPAAPFVLDLPNVMHLATDVRGTVQDGASSLGLVASLHPSAAVCGTPTDVAMRVIGEVEGLDRARYAGPVGWLDARGDGEWGIALRCAEVDPADPARLRLFAGCGIVAGSQPEDELAETHAKLVPMRDALEP